MRYGRMQHSGKRTLVFVLVAISLLALLLPSAWTGKLISLVQVILPFQHAVTSVVDTVRGDGSDADRLVSGAEYETLRRREAALRHRLAALSLRSAELESQVRLLEATRQWEVEGRSIGARGKLIPARVVTEDLLAWRSSRLINAGSLQGVSHGDAVASQHFSIDQGENGGAKDGMAILMGESLIGLIEQTGTHASRVKLLSDVSVEMKVRLGRFDDEGFMLHDGYYWLLGTGGGRMEIRDVDKRNVDDGTIGVGDIVLSDPRSELLPTALVIGTVVEITIDRDKPLFSVLAIESAADVSTIDRVYVYDPDSGETDR